MKKYLLILALFVAISCDAQIRTVTTRIDQNTIVKDENGTQLSYDTWKKIVATGDYSLKPVSPGATEFLLYKMSAEEKERALARKKAQLANMPRPTASASFPENTKFGNNRFTTITGEKFDTKILGEKIYVINFWFINCPPCKEEIPELNKLVEKYKSNDVVFIGIALDSKSELKNFLEKTPFNYNIVADGNFYASKFGVRSFPTNVIVGKDGVIKFSTTGLAPNTIEWIDKTLKEQLAATN